MHVGILETAAKKSLFEKVVLEKNKTQFKESTEYKIPRGRNLSSLSEEQWGGQQNWRRLKEEAQKSDHGGQNRWYRWQNHVVCTQWLRKIWRTLSTGITWLHRLWANHPGSCVEKIPKEVMQERVHCHINGNGIQ